MPDMLVPPGTRIVGPVRRLESGEEVIGPEPQTCPRCSRMFEGAFEIEDAKGARATIAGHVQGGRHCHPDEGLQPGERDARQRKATRRGR